MQKAKVLTGFGAFEAPKSSYFHGFERKLCFFDRKTKVQLIKCLNPCGKRRETETCKKHEVLKGFGILEGGGADLAIYPKMSDKMADKMPAKMADKIIQNSKSGSIVKQEIQYIHIHVYICYVVPLDFF